MKIRNNNDYHIYFKYSVSPSFSHYPHTFNSGKHTIIPAIYTNKQLIHMERVPCSDHTSMDTRRKTPDELLARDRRPEEALLADRREARGKSGEDKLARRTASWWRQTDTRACL